MNYILLICISLLFTFQKMTASERYVWKYNTIAHRLLQMEEQDFGMEESARNYQFDQKYKLMDKIFSECVINLTSFHVKNSTNKKDIYKALRCIDSTFAKNGFFISIPSYKLSTVFTPVEKKTLSKNIHINTSYRKSYYSTHSRVFYFDCDLSAILYLAVAEVANLPLNYIEVPNHAFVRWKINAVEYLNWDTNSADTISDELYRKGLSPTSKIPFSKIEELNCYYLQPWDENRLKAYYNYVIGRSFKRNLKYDLAKIYYEKSIKECPYFSTSKHALAYLLVFADSSASMEDIKHAMELESEVFIRNNLDDEVTETLACAFWLLGNSEMALVVLRYHSKKDTGLIEAINNGGNLISIYKKQHKVFN